MTTIRQPRNSWSIVPAFKTAENTAQKILIIGQMLGAGSATSGELQQNIGNGGEEDGLFGAKSMLAKLVRACKIRNKEVQVDAIGLDDAGGAADATGSVAVTGTATEAGTLTVIVGSERDHKYTISVPSGSTATAVGALIESAVAADTQSPVSASNTTGTVTFTSENGGTYGNSIPIEVRGSVGGITTAVTGMTGGSGDPTLTGVFDVVGDTRYQGVVWPYPDALTVVTTFLDARFNADGSILDGVAFTAKNDTAANLETLANAQNSESLVIFGGKAITETNYAGGDIVEIPMVKAAVWAGFRGLLLDSSAYSVSDLAISNNGPLDAFGGPAHASLPYFNTPVANLFPTLPNRCFTKQEIEDLHDAGVSVVGNNRANNGVITGEIVTTYKTDDAGNDDVTFKYLNYVDTSSQVREYFSNNHRSRFAKSRLTTGDTVKGRSMANANVIKSYGKSLYQTLSGPDYVLLESGEDALLFFDANQTVAINKANGRATITMQVPLVTQLREIVATIQIAFSTTS